MIKQDVLNAGYVRLVEYMGGDESVIIETFEVIGNIWQNPELLEGVN